MSRLHVVLLVVLCCTRACISIKGGREVKSWKEHSFMVALFAGHASVECGGALIHPMFILTAAHCFCDENLESLTVAVAQYALQRDHVTESHLRPIDKVHFHPEFSCLEFDKQVPVNDLALLQLRDLVPEEIGRPITLFTEHFKDDLPQTVELAGWGITDNGRFSNVLRAVQTELWPAYKCRNMLHRYQMFKNPEDVDYDKLYNYDQRQICTNGTMHGLPTDAAKGDSGGPVILRIPGEEPVLIGVISSSLNATSGDRYNPGVSINITYYKEWIQDIVAPRQETGSTVLPMDTSYTTRVEDGDYSASRIANLTFYQSAFDLNYMEIIELVYTPLSILILLGIMHCGGKETKSALFSKEWWWSGFSIESASANGVLYAGLGYAVIKLAIVCGYCAQNVNLWNFKRILAIFVCFLLEIIITTVRYLVIRKLRNQRKLVHNNPVAGSKRVHIASANKSIEEIHIAKDWVTNGARYLDRLNELKRGLAVDSCNPALVKLLEGFSLMAPEGVTSAILKYPTEKWNENKQFVMLGEAYPIPKENERRTSDVLFAQCYGYQILQALDFLHKKNLIHGALDLTTVFVDKSDNSIKIYGYLDRELRLMNRDNSEPEQILWHAFLSPESLFELINEKSTFPVTTKSDMWSFACLMVYLLDNSFTFSVDKFQRRNYAIKYNANGTVCVARKPGRIVDLYAKEQAHLDYDSIADRNVQDLLDRCFRIDPHTRLDAPAALALLLYGQNPLLRTRR